MMSFVQGYDWTVPREMVVFTGPALILSIMISEGMEGTNQGG